MQCPGDPGQKCGSDAYVNVYKTPISMSHTIDAVPKIVDSGDTVILGAVVEPPSIAFDLRLDYNNFAGLTEYHENGTGILHHVYAKAGQYEIQSYITDTGNLLPVSIHKHIFSLEFLRKKIVFKNQFCLFFLYFYFKIKTCRNFLKNIFEKKI